MATRARTSELATQLEIRALNSFDELEQIRQLWGEAEWPRPDPDRDFYLAVVRSRREVERPYVVVITRAGSLVGMVVARIERIPFECRIGHKIVYRPRVRSITVVPDGVHGGDDPTVAAAVVEELAAALARGEADVVQLPHVPATSPLHDAAAAQPGRLFRGRLDPHWTAVIPDSLEDFLGARSRNTRENVKRYGKRLVREFGDRLRVEAFRAGADVDRLFSELDTVAAMTYQRRLGVGFADTEEQRRLVEFGLERDWFRAWILSIDDRPRAFWHGYAYRGTFFIGAPGFDPALGQYRVGTFLQMRMTEDLCRDPAVSAIDYGFGDAQYKRSFGDHCREEADVVLFAPTARGASLSVARNATVALDRVARRALERTGVLQRVKQTVRRGRSGATGCYAPAAMFSGDVFGAAKVGVWRLHRSIRRRGLMPTARAAAQMIKSLPTRRRAARIARDFDERYGVDTADVVHLGALQIDSPNLDEGTRYQASNPDDFRALIGALPIDYREYVFVDFGSGKGRALLLAGEFPFKRIVGVEFSAELNEVARRNVELFPSERRRCEDVQLITIDATEYDIPPDPLVLYFYNPFAESVLVRVLGRVRASHAAQPRSIFVVFTGDAPVGAAIEAAGFSRLGVGGTDPARGIFVLPSGTAEPVPPR